MVTRQHQMYFFRLSDFLRLCIFSFFLILLLQVFLCSLPLSHKFLMQAITVSVAGLSGNKIYYWSWQPMEPLRATEKIIFFIQHQTWASWSTKKSLGNQHWPVAFFWSQVHKNSSHQEFWWNGNVSSSGSAELTVANSISRHDRYLFDFHQPPWRQKTWRPRGHCQPYWPWFDDLFNIASKRQHKT